MPLANGIADTPITILVGNKIAPNTLYKTRKIRKSPVLAKAQSIDPQNHQTKNIHLCFSKDISYPPNGMASTAIVIV